MNDSTNDNSPSVLVGRRRFLALGGLTVASAAALSACGGSSSSGSVARVGLAPVRTSLPEAVVNDVVLLRTAASLERSIAAAYADVIGNTELLAADYEDAAVRFRADHEANAEAIDDIVTGLGGEPWPCGNPRVDLLVVGAMFTQIEGDEAAGIKPSDDPQRDVLNMLHGLETMATQSHQSFVAQLSDPELRKAVITVGAQEARHAAYLAMRITGVPDGYVPPADPPADAPKIPVVYAIPAPFGQLGGEQIVVGAENEDGVRRAFNLDTPSLNTFVYENLTPEC